MTVASERSTSPDFQVGVAGDEAVGVGVVAEAVLGDQRQLVQINPEARQPLTEPGVLLLKPG